MLNLYHQVFKSLIKYFMYSYLLEVIAKQSCSMKPKLFFLITVVLVIYYKPKQKFLGISVLKLSYKTAEGNLCDIFSKLFVLQK